jgi:hypothetical protein
MTIIKDGTGTGKTLRIDNTNRADTHAVTIVEAAEAAENGDAYNLNTGTIGLTSSTESGIFYVKNNEDRDLEIDAVAIGIGSAGTTSEVSTITIVRNPTSVSFSTAVDMNANRNFGSSKTLTADVFKGAEAATITGGTDLAQFYLGAGGRLFAAIDLVIPKGNSMAIKIDTNTTSGTTNVYAALVCHLKRID